MKFRSLLKASSSDNMKIFKINSKGKGIKKFLFPLLLLACIIYSFAFYSYQMGDALKPYNLTYLMLSVFYLLSTVLVLIQGIYKSQSILFDCKDNDLLFSLPIPKTYILIVRIIKMFVYQIIYSSLFFLPSIIGYGILERPSLYFYILSLLVMILLPLIPTVIALIIGYFIKGVSSNFKSKKIIQSFLSIILFASIYYISFNIKSFMKVLVNNATSFESILNRLCYPLSLYIKLINKFNFLDFLQLILINILPIILFIYLGSKLYFKINMKLKDGSSVVKNKHYKNKISGSISSLVKKDLKIFFNSSTYMINATFMLFLFFILVIVLVFKFDASIDFLIKNMTEKTITAKDVLKDLPLYYYSALVFVSFTVFINCSTVSLEGKNINLIKSLPISEKKYFLSKIIYSNVLVIPILLISDIIFIIFFKINLLYSIYILLLTFIAPTLTGLLQLLINLIYPKFKFSNDAEVVKQSMSAFVAMCVTFLLSGVFTVIRFACTDMININLYILLELLFFILLSIILWIIINTYGKKLYSKFNI